MNALFFGTSDAPLYGVYHPPRARSGKHTGVVLCPPFGQEYMRSHRAFRQLALSLAKAGYHVFRFDYRGTGDSWGEGEAFTLAGGIDDTLLAIEELQAMADVDAVVLIGLRLGGAIAAKAVAETDAVTALVLWDPVLEGAPYLAELRAGGGAADLSNVRGYSLDVALRQELTALRFEEQVPDVDALLLVRDAPTPASDRLVAAGRAAGARAEVVESPLPGRWDEVDNWGSAMIPQDAIRSIAGWIEQEIR